MSRHRAISPGRRVTLILLGFASVIAGSMIVLAVAAPGTAPAEAVATVEANGGPPVTTTEAPTTKPTPARDELELRLVSEDGRYQAWSDPLPDGATIYEPGGRTQTTIVVKDRLIGTDATITLDHNVEPEAFSPDGNWLYVIDHRPARAPEQYRVSSIDLRSGELADVLGPLKLPVPEEMRGTGRQQVWAPDGTQLYTLYVRQYHDEPTHGLLTNDDPPEAAFVHVLDVANGWAVCLLLPDGFGLGAPGTTAIMVRDGGLIITVVDHHLGLQVDITRLPDTPWEQARFAVGEPRPVVST